MTKLNFQSKDNLDEMRPERKSIEWNELNNWTEPFITIKFHNIVGDWEGNDMKFVTEVHLSCITCEKSVYYHNIYMECFKFRSVHLHMEQCEFV